VLQRNAFALAALPTKQGIEKTMMKWIVLVAVLLMTCGTGVAGAQMPPPGTNLLQNPGFEDGYSGFTSYYQNSHDASDPGTFVIGSDPGDANSNWANSVLPHSGNAMMIVNGADDWRLSVWSEGPLNVQPHTTYVFTGFVSSLFRTSPPNLILTINGQQLGSALSLGPTVGQWTEFSVSWDSGMSNTATLAIFDQNTEAYGNDFALDDLGFATNATSVVPQQVQTNGGSMTAVPGNVNVSVTPANVSVSPANVSVYAGLGIGLAIIGIGLCFCGVGLGIIGLAIIRLAATRNRNS
jgi:hypothetical protein